MQCQGHNRGNTTIRQVVLEAWTQQPGWLDSNLSSANLLAFGPKEVTVTSSVVHLLKGDSSSSYSQEC